MQEWIRQTADTNVYSTGEAIIIPPTDADRALTHLYQPKSLKTSKMKQKDIGAKSQHIKQKDVCSPPSSVEKVNKRRKL